MRTAVVSDLHLGALGGDDLARRPAALERLAEAIDGAERVVFLGDMLELRELRPAALLALVRPAVERLGAELRGKRVTLVPGNHDHSLAEPWLSRQRLAGGPLEPQGEWPVRGGAGDGAAGVVASWMPGAEVTLAYPGLELGPGVYATHGHYLDVLLTIPRLEAIAASAMRRLTGRGSRCESAEDFEAVLAPLYGFYAGLVQGAASDATLERGTGLSRSVWSQVTRGNRATRVLLGGIAIPAAVMALNRIGLGPFGSELSAAELRRSGLLAMGLVAEALAPGAGHVLFGHTHRPGPLPGDDEAEWTTLSGIRLWNTGSWYLESAFVAEGGERSPYWPGTVTWVEPGREPRIDNALRGFRASSGQIVTSAYPSE